MKMDKLVVTLVGRDSVGIIAKVCTYFANTGINILDIAQTTVRDIINMVMVVDIEPSDSDYEKVKSDLLGLSNDVRCIISIVKDSELDNF